MLKLWDAATGKETTSWEIGAYAHGMAFAPDGKTLATGTWTRELQLREAKTWKVLATVPAAHEGDGFGALAFSPDGKVLATAGYDRVAKLWDVEKIVEKKP